VVGDGFAGVPEKAPYDRIIVTAAAEQVPQALLEQLADDGGVMILPLGPRDGPQHIIKLTKSQTEISRENLIAVRFVPLLPGQAQEL
jgi:protein-L-isoaspartate(D-aspartate) O-methyltransferase